MTLIIIFGMKMSLMDHFSKFLKKMSESQTGAGNLKTLKT